jgi:hypothetical protein
VPRRQSADAERPERRPRLGVPHEQRRAGQLPPQRARRRLLRAQVPRRWRPPASPDRARTRPPRRPRARPGPSPTTSGGGSTGNQGPLLRQYGQCEECNAKGGRWCDGGWALPNLDRYGVCIDPRAESCPAWAPSSVDNAAECYPKCNYGSTYIGTCRGASYCSSAGGVRVSTQRGATGCERQPAQYITCCITHRIVGKRDAADEPEEAVAEEAGRRCRRRARAREAPGGPPGPRRQQVLQLPRGGRPDPGRRRLQRRRAVPVARDGLLRQQELLQRSRPVLPRQLRVQRRLHGRLVRAGRCRRRTRAPRRARASA